MNTENYMQRRATVQQNYIFELKEQAIQRGDVPSTIGASAFMLGYYFRLGYDDVFRQYWDGTGHKLHWQGLGVQVDLGTRIKAMTDKFKPLPVTQPTQVYVYEGGIKHE